MRDEGKAFWALTLVLPRGEERKKRSVRNSGILPDCIEQARRLCYVRGSFGRRSDIQPEQELIRLGPAGETEDRQPQID